MFMFVIVAVDAVVFNIGGDGGGLCMCARTRARVRACVCACVRVCVSHGWRRKNCLSVLLERPA